MCVNMLREEQRDLLSRVLLLLHCTGKSLLVFFSRIKVLAKLSISLNRITNHLVDGTVHLEAFQLSIWLFAKSSGA